MSIKLIAQEIYRLMRESDRIKALLEKAPLTERTQIEERLRVVQAELTAMRRAIAGALDKKE